MGFFCKNFLKSAISFTRLIQFFYFPNYLKRSAVSADSLNAVEIMAVDLEILTFYPKMIFYGFPFFGIWVIGYFTNSFGYKLNVIIGSVKIVKGAA